MHYAISYDIENDRLREKTAKLLERHGCCRIQKSVFVAPAMEKKHYTGLLAGLRGLFGRIPLSPADSVVLIPVRDEYVGDIVVYGSNNIRAVLEDDRLKIML